MCLYMCLCVCMYFRTHNILYSQKYTLQTVSIAVEPAAQHNAATTTTKTIIICLLFLLLGSCCSLLLLCTYGFIGLSSFCCFFALLCFAYTTFHYTHHTVRHSMIYSIVECSIVIWFSVTIRSTLALLQYALCALFFGIKTHNINGILVELLKNSH